MEYYCEGPHEQCPASGEQQYFVEDEQRQSGDERYISQHSQRVSLEYVLMLYVVLFSNNKSCLLELSY